MPERGPEKSTLPVMLTLQATLTKSALVCLPSTPMPSKMDCVMLTPSGKAAPSSDALARGT